VGEPWLAGSVPAADGAKEPRNAGLLSYAHAYITSLEMDSGRGPRALNGGTGSAR